MWPFKRRTLQALPEPPLTAEAKHALAVLGAVPGPSPWYLSFPASAVTRDGKALEWRPAGEGNDSPGKSLLTAPDGTILAIADFQCHVKALEHDRFLVWWAEEHGEGPLLERLIQLRIYETRLLPPIDDISGALSALGGHSRFHARDGISSAATISAALADGEHQLELPPAFSSLGDVSLLVHSTADGRRENHFDQMHLRIWLLDTKRGTLSIIPQDWFNEGPYDFTYQWVTRVAWDSASGRIVGEGIRLGLFALDHSRRQIERWYLEYPFYMPRVTRG